MTANDIKVSLVTTELTTRGWLEQVASIGYFMEKRIDDGDFHLMSSFGVIAEQADEPVDLLGLLESPALKDAEVVIIDRASQMIPADIEGPVLLSLLRQYTAEGRTLFLMIDLSLIHI